MTRAGCIHILPDLIVNKIAAGEVVERPASVVKELVDNAIDAEAARIAVTIEDGGKQLIRVTDDGVGMTRDELRLSVTPHATSKIDVEDDLYSISTMGFRGEALASISAVAKLRMVSRPRDQLEGHEIRVAGEQLESSQAAGCPPGTTVEIRDLFFNVPARRKFLRARSTEVGHINEQIARAALAHPNITFELSNNGRTTHNLPQCDSRLKRISRFYGSELASDLLRIDRSERGLSINAYAAPPAHSRANTQWQYVFVNGRYIRDRFVQHAIKEAYRGLMEHNRQAVIFLFLTIDPELVDVNVHPTKIEVRWADSNMVHSQVLSALRETFQQCDLTPALRMDKAAAPPVDAAEMDRMRRDFAEAMKTMSPLVPSRDPAALRPLPAEGDRMGPHGVSDGAPAMGGSGDTRSRGMPGGVDPVAPWRALYGQPDAEQPLGPADQTAPLMTNRPMPPAGDASATPPSGLRPRAIQMHNLYLVTETADGIAIIDQHALHERIMYEELRRRFTEGPLEAQRLLLPETLNVTAQQAALLETHADLLHRLGIEVAAFGSDSIAVSAFPVLLGDADVVGFMRDLLDHLAQLSGSTSTEIVIHPILDMMACKAAVKAGDSLSDAEIQALIERKDLVDKSSNCPHGRPTMLRFSKADLARQFKRT